MRISDWSLDVCSSDLVPAPDQPHRQEQRKAEINMQRILVETARGDEPHLVFLEQRGELDQGHERSNLGGEGVEVGAFVENIDAFAAFEQADYRIGDGGQRRLPRGLDRPSRKRDRKSTRLNSSH